MQLSRAKPGNPASIYIGECVCVCLCVYPSGRIHVAACGPIGTKFGTRMEIHLEMVMGEIKITPCDLGGIWGGFGVRKYQIWNNYQTAGSIDTNFGTHVQIHLEMVMGEIKITPCDLGGIWGVLGVRK